jgi:hypothetical protein
VLSAMRCALIYIVLKVSGHYEFVLVSFNILWTASGRTHHCIYTHIYGGSHRLFSQILITPVGTVSYSFSFKVLLHDHSQVKRWGYNHSYELMWNTYISQVKTCGRSLIFISANLYNIYRWYPLKVI